MSNMSRAIEKLIQLLSMNFSKSIFSTKRSTSTTLQLIDLASVAAGMYTKHGQGIVIAEFNNCEECEDLVIELSIAVQENASKYPG